MNEPVIQVGIVAAKEISFALDGVFTSDDKRFSGVFIAIADEENIFIGNESASEWIFEPLEEASFFEIHNVTIGIEFHWERRETQRFKGALKLIVENNQVRVINQIRTEDYLVSVISSEMSAHASGELLKAHAVISRSWLLYPILHAEAPPESTAHLEQSDGKLIRWYERDAHHLFDVCADDHCQRYQGITRASTDKVRDAVRETEGLVLMDGDQVCDARYYKACGGITERFDSCWANQHFSYLQPVRDAAGQQNLPDLTTESNARKWILSSPEAFCNTNDRKVLAQVLNNYDQETTDFYRWKISYSQRQLAELLKKKSGIDFGAILHLEPVKRGPSGRIIELKITGTRATLTVGKELEIRKWLSDSHLYSSAFVVEHIPAGAEVPGQFILSGAGWGHGVGLCQIGAAVMGDQGYSYHQILTHYFHHATIQKIY